ncbi:MAG: tRNA (adenosine(37)-N6)-dimethylallyltransferase MiaA [Tepidisphaera sp.]|nr:tRNA (adenosine(37)-N6)-dimethylallyltransferase MiaA [Tepidisphaera sp.]
MPLLTPIIAGPTAGGKSALAVELALRVRAGALAPHVTDAEIITADAFQIYRGLDIGTAKPTLAERRGVVHHLIDVVEPSESFSVSQWLQAAEAAIAAVRGRGHVPIVVGGTHLYVKALLDGLFEGPGASPELRAELNALSPAALRAELERVDPKAAARLHPNDLRRSVRALEVFRLTGRPISELQTQWDNERGPSPYLLVTLEWPVEAINRRINERVRQMMAQGLEQEARRLEAAGVLGPQAREALGYKQLLHAFVSGSTIEDAVEEIKIETRRFAKNQRTWLKRLRAVPGMLNIEVECEQGAASDEWAARIMQRLHPSGGQ